MLTYSAGRFKSTYDTTEGATIWAFLTQTDSILRMETATYLSRPAIEPLSPYLTERFGQKITADRIKQMMGHMVRQIMEQSGYQLEQSNVKIVSPNNIFSRASRYSAAKGQSE